MLYYDIGANNLTFSHTFITANKYSSKIHDMVYYSVQSNNYTNFQLQVNCDIEGLQGVTKTLLDPEETFFEIEGEQSIDAKYFGIVVQVVSDNSTNPDVWIAYDSVVIPGQMNINGPIYYNSYTVLYIVISKISKILKN